MGVNVSAIDGKNSYVIKTIGSSGVKNFLAKKK